MIKQHMSDEDLSELAEALEDACVAAKAKGKNVSVFRLTGCVCPLGAMFGGTFPWANTILFLPLSVTTGFACGFDGNEPAGDPRAFALGAAFRRRALGAE